MNHFTDNQEARKEVGRNMTPFIALGACLTPALAYVVSVLLFICGVPMNGFILPVAMSAAIAIAAKMTGLRGGRAPGRGIAAMLIIVGISIIAGSLIIDYSPDGIEYHQEIIALLCDGWNPYRMALPEGPDSRIVSIWALHYAKGVEIAQASVAAFTRNIESGKAINFIMTFGVGAAVYDFLRNRPEGFIKGRAWLITFATMANPVIWEQIFTYYIDFYKYLYLLLLLIGILRLGSEDIRDRHYGSMLVAIAVVMSVATKFNFFFECALWGLAAVIWVYCRKDYSLLRRLLLVGGVTFVAGILLAWHPYVTNYLRAGHPLYPLMGEGAVDIMTGNTTPEFIGYDRFTNFFRSLLLPSMQIDCDQRQSGFTILMPFILIFSVAGAFMGRRRVPGVVWYISTLCLLSCFIFEQTWWTRYICQLWLLPAILLPYCFAAEKSRVWGRLAAWLMIPAGLYAGAWACKHEFVIGSYNRKLLSEAQRAPITVIGAPVGAQYRHHFGEKMIYFNVVDTLPPPSELKGKRVLYYIEERPPLIIVSESQAKSIRDYLEGMKLNFDRHEKISDI